MRTQGRQYVFVGGAARTGTTLLQSMLCGLPGSGCFLPEAIQIRQLFEAYRRMADYEKRSANAFFGGDERQQYAFGQLLRDLLAAFDPESLARFLVLKHPALTPLFPALIEMLREQGRFICLVRDPRDAIASMVRWGQRAAENGTFHWFATRNTRALSRYFLSFYGPLFESRSSGRITVVRYEDLVDAPDQALSGFVTALGVGPEVLQGGHLTEWGDVDLSDQGQHAAASSPLYGRSVSRERVGSAAETLTAKELAEITGYCAQFLQRFHYEAGELSSVKVSSIALEEFVGVEDPVQPLVGDSRRAAQDQVAAELAELRRMLAQKTDSVDKLKAQNAQLRSRFEAQSAAKGK